MKGHGDLFVGFFERSLRMLVEDGRVGFICADRWMRNTYGRDLRAFVSRQFSVEHVWTMHDVDAFESEVSAYPAITVLARRPQAQAVVVDTNASFGATDARALCEAVRVQAVNCWKSPTAKAHTVDTWFSGTEHWPTGSPARLAMVGDLNERFPALEDSAPGTRVRIGIATGADKTFITTDPELVESSRLLPLVVRQDLMTGHSQWGGRYLINPWDDEGQLVDLGQYPKLRAHFDASPQLRERFVARRNPAHWYRTIDKVNPALVGQPKLLIQDMKATIHPVLEHSAYPHHNLYAITSDGWDLEVLGGLLLSRVAQAFVEAYGVRMRGGTLRFQAQYLRKIRAPRPETIAPADAERLREAFQNRDVDLATATAATLYGVDIRESELEG